MEEEMEMEMEIEIEPVFEVREVDLEYEFDAARFFDFTREESPAEAREAELWFESAPSYPPSPFVAKLVLRDESLLENVSTSPKCKEVEDTSTLLENDSGNVMALEFSAMGPNNRGIEGTNKGIFTDIQKVLQKALNQPFQLTAGFTTYNYTSSDKLKDKSKSVKSVIPRSSTLMKPTASQLAKQNRPPQVAASRFEKQQLLNSDRSLGNSSVVESQAAKRQKLEGGLSRKVADVKQQTNLIHKAPKKEGTVDRNSIHTRLKLTIPKEPELETAHRAQRIRPKNSTEQEHVTSVTHRFKARPLNRKILEAPSLPLPKKSIPKLPQFQEFRLKTSERAVQLSSAVPSSCQSNDADKGSEKSGIISATGNGTGEPRRASAMVATGQDVCDIKYNFKARPLNKKIFSHKGDIGVFRNIKRETTVPMEFNFHAEKRVQQTPPVELFSKLSLTSELQPSNGSQIKLPRPTFTSTQGSKENRWTSFQPEHEMRHLTKEKPHLFGGKNIQCGNDGCITEVGNQLSTRSLGIR
ncbi:protein TPX2-like [Herrania umbratica]|uniref:Protein TPX2-like n=1 Tax=Herrania umbratica TaxID=108875 RepID=A0A6J1BJG3_9ROSI|nr:protein TPX2-like [Herrania umbratica]XP_021298417.1 protein TPX2-like [Herrania umbratica]